MTYICIRCERVWTIGVQTDPPHSGGLCDWCITDYIRNRQTLNGLTECFRTNKCPEGTTSCVYKDVCKGRKII